MNESGPKVGWNFDDTADGKKTGKFLDLMRFDLPGGLFYLQRFYPGRCDILFCWYQFYLPGFVIKEGCPPQGKGKAYPPQGQGGRG